VLLVGQATFGWEWPSGPEKETAGSYPEWRHQPIRSFRDFVTDEQSVDWLMRGYELFDFGARQPRSRNGAFWRFYREVLASLHPWAVTGMWSNLFRVDVGGYSPHLGDCANVICRYQRELLPAEIDLLKPSIIVFVTGWSLDQVIREQLGLTQSDGIEGIDSRVLSQLSVGNPMPLVFRTYHPAYLNRIGKFNDVVAAIGRESHRRL
jgi:hypothetical protein